VVFPGFVILTILTLRKADGVQFADWVCQKIGSQLLFAAVKTGD
jgi:hypothetical protein